MLDVDWIVMTTKAPAQRKRWKRWLRRAAIAVLVVAVALGLHFRNYARTLASRLRRTMAGWFFKKNATIQRNSSVEFSPFADRILVGSWDNTLSVFSIAENGK